MWRVRRWIIWFKSDISLAPHYWYVEKAWEIWDQSKWWLQDDESVTKVFSILRAIWLAKKCQSILSFIIYGHLHVPGNGIPSGGGWWFMVFNVTFNNISVISWWSVLLVEETWVPRENHQPAASHFLWSPTLWNISNGEQVRVSCVTSTLAYCLFKNEKNSE